MCMFAFMCGVYTYIMGNMCTHLSELEMREEKQGENLQ